MFKFVCIVFVCCESVMFLVTTFKQGEGDVFMVQVAGARALMSETIAIIIVLSSISVSLGHDCTDSLYLVRT